LILITGDAKKDLKIKFECEVSEINFTPLTRQEANTLGEMAPAENADDSGETPKSSLEAFGINPSVTYGDTAPTTYGDESDSSQEEAPPAKKKKTVTPPPEEEDEVPAPKKSKKPVVEDEEPVSQPKKPKKPAVVEEETQPAPKKKSKKNVE
jgi:hypothetical protein